MITTIVSRLRRTVEGPARRNTFGSLLIQGGQRLSRFAVVIAAAALLTPAAFAAVALAVALTDLVRGSLQAFDVDAVRLLSRGDDAPRVVQASLDAKSLAGCTGLVTVAMLAVFIYGSETALLVAISGAGMLAASLGSSFLVQRQAALALHSISSRVTAASAAGAVLGLILAWLTRSAMGVVLGFAIGDGLLLALVCGAHRWQWPDWRGAAAQVRHSRELLVMQLAYIGQFRIGTIVLAAVGSAVAVGEYAIASRIAEGLVVMAAAITASTLPLIGTAHARDQRGGLASIFEKSYGMSVRIIAPLVAALIIAAPVWISAVFPKYPNVGPPSGIVGLAVIIFFASSQTTTLLNATHRDRAASWSAVCGLAASMLGSFSLVSLGAVGVAWARVAGELVRLLVEAAASVRELAIGPVLLLRPWFSVSPILAAIAIVVAGNWKTPYIWIAALIVLIGAAALLRSFLSESRSRMRGTL